MNYEKMSKEDLINVVKTLTLIRENYEKKFGQIMYANGETKKGEIVMENYSKVFDNKSKEWSENPEYNLIFIKAQQSFFNDVLRVRGHVFLNEIHDALGIARTQEGQVVGWLNTDGKFIDFNAKLENDGKIDLNFNVDGIIMI